MGTCHWCHVMERESFEDEEVARLLNEAYVAIKVDREERPDIDHIYMTVCQGLTGQGGWPLTVLLTPEQEPFFAGTYFPKEARYGRPGLMDVLRHFAEQWRAQPETVRRAAKQITEFLQSHSGTPSAALGPEAIGRDGQEADAASSWLNAVHAGYQTLREQFDDEFGGFGEAPKFPTPHQLMFLLRYGRRFDVPEAHEMVKKTLDAMFAGGIYDHVGGGFARYSTDRMWLVPHFEKMLYDDALLAVTYVEAGQATGEERYFQVAKDILQYLQRDMTSPEGGFYSAEDADSEGEEGKFYLWTSDEVISVLGQAAGERWCRCYGVEPGGNFEGRSIPNLIGRSLEAFAAAEGIDPDAWRQELDDDRRRLFAAREQRVHPAKDDKVLTGWNGLAIAAFAKAGRVLQEPQFVNAAKRAAQFIRQHLRRPDGRLLARYRAGESKHLGYVDDYAFLIWGLLELYEATFDADWLSWALALQDDMHRNFWDDKAAGFFVYGEDSEQLIARPKEFYDGATPSGNSVAAMNMLRLAKMTGNTKWDDTANALLRLLSAVLEQYPAGYAWALSALMFALGPTREIVIAGPWPSEETAMAAGRIGRVFLPDAVMLLRPDGDAADEIGRLAPYVAGQHSLQGRPTVYVCENYACQAPTDDIDSVVQQLQAWGKE